MYRRVVVAFCCFLSKVDYLVCCGDSSVFLSLLVFSFSLLVSSCLRSMSGKISRTKRSPVWAYFEESGGSVTCNLCKQKLVRTSGTTNLFSHLKTHHKEQHAAASGAQAPVAGSTTVVGTKSVASFFPSSSTRTCDSKRAGTVTDYILDWVVDSLRPLSVVEDKGFVNLLKLLEPEFKAPSRTHLAKLMDKRHSTCKSELKAMLKSGGVSGVSLTTDGWSSTATQSFVTHTVHFINDEWQLVNGVLETAIFKGSHTAEKLAECTQQVVQRFGIKREQVVAVSHDEAANMVAAARILTEEESWESNVCMAHRLQTAIRHGLDLDVVSKLLARGRRLVSHFKHSCIAAEALESKQTQLNASQTPLKVIQDVPTRWNSSFYMLRRLLQLRVALIAVLCDPSVTPKQADRDLLLKDSQWKLAEQLVEILEPFENATTAISGQKYVTLSLLMPIASHLYSAMAGECNKQGLATAAKSVARKLKSEMLRKFPDVCCPSPMSLSVVCACLDPRFRCLQFLDDEKAEATKEHVKDLLLEHTAAASSLVTPVEPPAKKKPVPTSGLSRLLSRGASDDSAAGSDSRLKELDIYFKEGEADVDVSPLDWWKVNASRYPHLSQLARRYLSVPATSVPSERIFSAAGRLVTKLRSRLSPSHVDAAIFLSVNSMLPGARFSNVATVPLATNLAALEEEEEAEEEVQPPLPSLSDEELPGMSESDEE